MKKLLVFSILALSSLNSFAKTTNPATKHGHKKETAAAVKPDGGISTTWTIGRRSRNCNSIGICKIKKVVISGEGIDVTVYGNRMFAGTVTPKDENSFLYEATDEILKDIVSEFKGEYIVLEEDFVVDEDIAKELGLAKDFTIKAGTYNLVKNEKSGMYEVVFKN